ncbi:DUF4007 family protein [Rhizobium leguminosarum]|uniref:DUF4007 family protein n=1 Tax=Rhizobium leguminosarum TaxID=384 RepID=UPI000380B632|nr:DUF4007 family protein [Rhizobium leguminosarum]
MARSLLEENQFQLQFAGHETFPLRYGWLKKSYDAITKALFDSLRDPRSVFTDESAIADFGVGKNMVTAMRHWSLACGILESVFDEETALPQLRPTRLAHLLFSEGGDPYLELPASLWLLHWSLTSVPGRATTWYWAFNEFNEPTFSRDLLRTHLLRRCDDLRAANRLKHSRISEATLKGDVLCFIRSYATKPDARGSEEDNLECPLTELSLLQPVNIGTAFQFRRGPKSTLPDEVFLFGLLAFWQQLWPSRREFSVEAITHEPGSPGRVFMLDEETVAERLSRLTELTRGAVVWDESTGMRQVYAPNILTLDPFDYVKRLYGKTKRELHD